MIYNAELFVNKSWRPRGYFQFEVIINVLVALSDSFEYLCYGSTAIRYILILSVRGPSLYVRISRRGL